MKFTTIPKWKELRQHWIDSQSDKSTLTTPVEEDYSFWE